MVPDHSRDLSVANRPYAGSFSFDVDGFCGSCREFVKGSKFLTDLYADGVAAPGVTYTTTMSRYDELVTPYTSGVIDAPGATNFVLQDVCSTDTSEHAAVAFDAVAERLT